MKMLLVGGTFGKKGTKDVGRKSTIIDIVAAQIKKMNHDLEWVNGGYFEDLEWIYETRVPEYSVVLWFPNVPNDQDKIRDIKARFPKTILVTSKRNLDGRYSFAELVNHALGLKSNLVIELTSDDTGYLGRLFDPLGCIWADTTSDFEFIARSIVSRLEVLARITRNGSVNAGIAQPIPDDTEFFALVKEYGKKFHDLIHPADGVERFLGNASFRCERGFPSFKSRGLVFVSSRNVDKRHIDRSAFVATQWDGYRVLYYGDRKPSVDTPVQSMLYGAFPRVTHMLHSHVYVDGALFTKTALPCGAIEEFEEIAKLFSPTENMVNFAVNLLGHGSMVLADDLQYMKSVRFYARPMPELMPGSTIEDKND